MKSILRRLLSGENAQLGSGSQMKILFERALFASAPPESVELICEITVSGSRAKVDVGGSGQWDATYSTNTVGAETIVFETNAAKERMIISPSGEALWELDYFDKAMEDDHVIAFAGMRVEHDI